MPEEPRRREQRLQTIRAAKAPLEAGQAAADRAKGRSPGDDRVAGGEWPPGGRSKFKQEFGEPEPSARRNFSDPESRIMKPKQSFEPCCKARALAEEANQLIVAREVGQSPANKLGRWRLCWIR